MDLILDSDYLSERFRLFEKYTLPSIQNQTSQNFQWIVLFHKRTPETFKEKIRILKKVYAFIDLYFEDDEFFDFASFVSENKYDSAWFITSRIDNDDILNSKYIDIIQKYAKDNLRQCVLTFEKGEKLNNKTGKRYVYLRKDNHFLSMIASRDYNIFQYNHSKILGAGLEIVALPSPEVMWVEIVHETNVANRIKDYDLLVDCN